MPSREATIFLPTDPAERRRLWRDWIQHDVPGRPVAARRVAIEPTQESWIEQAIPHPPGVIAGLRIAIDECIIEGQLSLSDRQRLTRRATRLGLSRFEAALLIAAVLHQAGAKTPTHVSTRRLRWTIGRIVMIALIAEALIAAGVTAWLK